LAERHDYAGAVRLLEGVPAELRDLALFVSLTQKRDRVEQLGRALREQVDAGRFFALRETVEELLDLTPGRDDLRRLLEALPPAPRDVVNSLGMKLVLIPPGRFLMGSPEGEQGRGADEHQHEVEITRPFYLGVTPVTREQYRRVMGGPPGPHWERSLPAEQVSWHDAAEFCLRLA